MKRRKFLKFLALIPALPIACENPFKPKSKPPPIERYDPDDPVTESFFYNGKKHPGKFADYYQMVDLKFANGNIIKMRYGEFLNKLRKTTWT